MTDTEKLTAASMAQPVAAAADIAQAISKQDSKSALDHAKKIHQRHGTSDSERLLVNAYAVRIRALLDRDLMVESRDLLELVEKRHPQATQHFSEIRLALVAREGSLDTLVAGLNDPQLSSDLRASIETTIRQEVVDLDRLAACSALVANHPLKIGATAVVKALTAVTSGPVQDGDIALREVSHRSPLAPWKLLIWAIARLYRRDDSGCEELLNKIPPASAAGRLAPVLRALLQGQAAPTPRPESMHLVKAVLAGSQPLRDSLQSLDKAFAKKEQRALPKLIHHAVETCENACPELLPRLKQHISIRCMLLKVPAATVAGALGGPSLHDAYFWRLLARAQEIEHEIDHACSLWEEFRRHAVHEGWFKDAGPEAAALYLHMIDLLRRLADEDLEVMQEKFPYAYNGFADYYKNQPAEIQELALKSQAQWDFYFLDPERLYEKACVCQPDAEVFRLWLTHATKLRFPRVAADEVALKWHAALPADSKPLLHLMASARKRNALKKALEFLEKAEQRDSLNPEVKQARLRLWIATGLRHIRQNKPHLLEKDLDAIEQLPQAVKGDRPVLVAAMRWILASFRKDPNTSQRLDDIKQLAEDDVAATIVLRGVARACTLSDGRLIALPNVDIAKGSVELAQSLGRCCALFDDLAVPFEMTKEWESSLLALFSHGNVSPLDAGALRSLGETALRGVQNTLAFAISAAGLRLGQPHEARFLLLRARSLPERAVERRQACFAAAAEIARRQRDMDLVADIVDHHQRATDQGWASIFGGSSWADDLRMDEEQWGQVLEQEKHAQPYPSSPWDDEFSSGLLSQVLGRCQCPACQRARGKIGPRNKKPRIGRTDAAALQSSLFDDLLDTSEDEYTDEPAKIDDENLAPFGLDERPAEGLGILEELTSSNGGRMPTPQQIAKIIKKNPALGERMIAMMFNDLMSGISPMGELDDLLPPLPVGYQTRRKKTKRRRK